MNDPDVFYDEHELTRNQEALVLNSASSQGTGPP